MKILKKLSLIMVGLALTFIVSINANAVTTNYAAWAKCLLANANTVTYTASLVSLMNTP